MARTQPDLGAGELEVLKVLWDLGPTTVRGVREHLEGRGRSLAYNTVQTVLGRLRDKDFVAVDRRGQSHVFRARKTRDQVGRRRLRDLLQGVYDGAAGSLVAQLVRSGRLEPDEVDELQEMLDELASQRKRS